VTLHILEAYGSVGLMLAGLFTLGRLLIRRGFRLSFKAEVPRQGPRSVDD
jgi:hypothetical protein